MGIQDEAEDRILPKDDHDLLVRIHERLIALKDNLRDSEQKVQNLSDRVGLLERWQQNQDGRQQAMIRQSATVSSIISTVVSALIVYFLTHQ
jgi:CII-binding regulator of phage lambda lysogenization HflD